MPYYKVTWTLDEGKDLFQTHTASNSYRWSRTWVGLHRHDAEECLAGWPHVQQCSGSHLRWGTPLCCAGADCPQAPWIKINDHLSTLKLDGCSSYLHFCLVGSGKILYEPMGLIYQLRVGQFVHRSCTHIYELMWVNMNMHKGAGKAWHWISA